MCLGEQGDTTRKSRDGFALIEMMAALFVLSVGLFGVIEMFHYGLDKLHAVQESRIAVRSLQNEMETLHAVPFDKLVVAEDAPFTSNTPELEGLVNAETTVTIRDYAEGAGRLKEVIVQIAWTGEKGRRINKNLTTLLADRR